MQQSDGMLLEGRGARLTYGEGCLRVTWERAGEVMFRHADGAVISAHFDHHAFAVGWVRLQLRARMTLSGSGADATHIELSFPEALAAEVKRLADWINADSVRGEPMNAGPEPPEWVNESRPPARGADDGMTDRNGAAAEEPGDERHGAAEPSAAPRVPGEPEARPPAPAPEPTRPHDDPLSPVPAERPAPSRLRHPSAGSHPAPPSPVAAPPPPLPVVTFRVDLSAWASDQDWIGLYPTRETIRLIEAPSPGPPREPVYPPSA